jgi:uncharacterized protein involved in exopolysaccharide biosynthesis
MNEVRFYLSRLVRHTHWITLLVIIGSAIGFGFTVLPQNFVGQARLLIEPQQISDELAPQTASLQTADQVDLIRQRVLRRQTVLDLARRMNLHDRASSASVNDPDRIVQDMRDRITLESVGGRDAPTVLTVAFRWPDAKTAAIVSNEILDIILRENVALRTQSASKTRQFFEQEVARLETILAEHDRQILSFTETHKNALPDSLEYRRKQQGIAQEHMLRLEGERLSALENRDAILDQMKLTGELQKTQGSSRPSKDQQKLQELRSELLAQQAFLSVENPKVRLLQSRVAALQSVDDGSLSDETPVNRDQALLVSVDRQIASLDRQYQLVANKVDALTQGIDATALNGILLDNLERAKQNARVQYDLAIGGKARAETGEMIEMLQQGQRLSIFEKAVTPQRPQGFSKRFQILLGAAAGLLVGICMSLAFTNLSPVVRRSEDLVKGLGITPFAVIPHQKNFPARLAWEQEFLPGRATTAMVILCAHFSSFAPAPFNNLIGS